MKTKSVFVLFMIFLIVLSVLSATLVYADSDGNTNEDAEEIKEAPYKIIENLFAYIAIIFISSVGIIIAVPVIVMLSKRLFKLKKELNSADGTITDNQSGAEG